MNSSHIKLAPIISGGTGSDSLNLELRENETSFYEVGTQNVCAIGALAEGLSFVQQTDCKGIEQD